MFKNLKKRSEGFTIIEVMIVLAIGGLIMLIVFLAVPSLQRSQRNTNRNNDATRWAAAVTECLANHNNVVGSCASTGSTVQGAAQLTTNGSASQTSVLIAFSQTCSADGTTTAVTTVPTSFTVSYLLETATGTQTRCIGS
ncbi:MAG: prepilin-type N-terminal cleavage/methylation domain-containing protein [Candidatus Saccharibacteria bacterium]|nr:prepilin-type N-terminal cleavage/methylation domain-containing protein [Candidatus Saccharibacteria bacterium]